MATFEQEKAKEILDWLQITVEQVREQGALTSPFMAYFGDELNDLLTGVGTDQRLPAKQKAFEFLKRVRSRARVNHRDGTGFDADTVQRIRHALDVIAGDEQKIEGLPGAQNEYQATDRDQSGKLPDLGPYDRQAYQLSIMHGVTQALIAEKLNKEHGTAYKQGQISRMIKRAKRHAEASGLSKHIPDLAKRAKAMDPDRLDLGQRTDHLSQRQRARRQ